jgi:DNA helicase-2/ATP-dependent DNA helicase PcrA
MLNTVQSYLSEGVNPREIGYLAFTTKAAKEAKARALDKFPHLNANHLQGFRTIHSLCYAICGYNRGDIIQRNHYSDLCKKLNIPYSGYVNMEEGSIADVMPGDKLIFIEGLAKARRRTFMDEFDDAQSPGVGRQEALLFYNSLKNFKEGNMLDDFNDMLLHIANGKFPVPSFEVLFVDEAQDLSKLQWDVVKKLIAKAKHVYIAGDDDQAIFSWAGADPESFLGLDGDTSVLSCKYRLPKKIFDMSKVIS